jgi:hypothetical protein
MRDRKETNVKGSREVEWVDEKDVGVCVLGAT